MSAEDKMINDLREGRVSVAQPEVDLESFSSNQTQPKPEVKQNPNLLERIDELTKQRVEKFEANQRELEKKYLESQQTQIEEKTPEIEPEQIQEIQEQEMISDKPTFEGMQEIELADVVQEVPDVQNDVQAKQKFKKAKFRVKFITIAVCIAIAMFSGLAIYNAVEINRLNTQIATNQTKVEVDTAKYIYKISKVDDLIEDGKKAPVDTFQIGADKYLESYPEEIEDVTQITQESNWFDRFVQSIRNFFGRK